MGDLVGGGGFGGGGGIAEESAGGGFNAEEGTEGNGNGAVDDGAAGDGEKTQQGEQERLKPTHDNISPRDLDIAVRVRRPNPYGGGNAVFESAELALTLRRFAGVDCRAGGGSQAHHDHVGEGDAIATVTQRSDI